MSSVIICSPQPQWWSTSSRIVERWFGLVKLRPLATEPLVIQEISEIVLMKRNSTGFEFSFYPKTNEKTFSPNTSMVTAIWS